MKITNRKAIIFGLSSHKLKKKEKSFLLRAKPWGIILFSRNIKSLNQLKKLINEIKSIFNDHNYPILIDQEGGAVSRINNIIDLSIFSQNFFAKLYESNKKIFFIYYKIYIDSVSNILKDVGININTVPVLDVMNKKSNNIIGSRSFSKKTEVVTKLGKLCIKNYMKNNIATVMKHIPGHGLANKDSHFFIPYIKEKEKDLIKKDFKPFKLCRSLFAMTAHVIYTQIDNKNTVTHSKKVITRIIRDLIKFKGILISDDISMKALKFSIEENAIIALKSGCNLVMHCNGKLNEMKKLSKIIPTIDNFTKKKTSDFYKFLG